MNKGTCRGITLLVLSVIGSAGVGLATAPSARAGGAEAVCVPAHHFDMLVARAEAMVLAATYGEIDAQLGEDEHHLAMLDALVGDCLEYGIATRASTGQATWSEFPTEEDCFEWAMHQLAGYADADDIAPDVDEQVEGPPIGSVERGAYCKAKGDAKTDECNNDPGNDQVDPAYKNTFCTNLGSECEGLCLVGGSSC